MDRLKESILFEPGCRFHMIYGDAIHDSFINRNHTEMDFNEALSKFLQKTGFKRMIWLSPSRPLFFLDPESRTQVEKDLWAEQDLTTGNSQSTKIQTGPLSPTDTDSQIEDFGIHFPDGVGDLHGLRIMDRLIRQELCAKTALIFLQAETTLQFFEDQRSLSSLIGDWLTLSSQNPNQVFFIFSAITLENLALATRKLNIPELRVSTEKPDGSNHPAVLLQKIKSPDTNELARLIDLKRKAMGFSIQMDEIGKLLGWMAAENLSLKTWMDRLSTIDRLSISSAKKAGWFRSVPADARPVEERLEELVGLDEIKQRIQELTVWFGMRKVQNSSSKPLLHMVFTGNPGTGKSTVASMMGEIFHELGFLKRGHLVQANLSNLVSDHIGGTAIKTNQLIDQAMDGVLFIDEAYGLSDPDRGSYGQEALEIILTRMEENRDRLSVVIAGYPEKMRHFLESNPGLSRRFPDENRFHFPDYSPSELWLILLDILANRGFGISDEFQNAAKTIIASLVENRNEIFGNAGEMRNLADGLERMAAVRAQRIETAGNIVLEVADIPPHYLKYLPQPVPTVDDLLSEFNHLIGLTPVKTHFKRLVRRIQFDQIRASNDAAYHSTHAISHMVFAGNPGTGKTTVARLVGKMLASLGLLRKGQCIEVSMTDLIAGYMGQTSAKTMNKIKEALDGVLFIDEAYSLSRMNGSSAYSYGQEVIDTLVKAMEDYRTRLVVIVAGYPDEILDFLTSNPGLKSRFMEPILFPDFNEEELGQILQNLAGCDQLDLPEEVQTVAVRHLLSQRVEHSREFGNARDVKKLYEMMKNKLSERVIETSQRDQQGNFVFSSGWNAFSVDDIEPDHYSFEIPPDLLSVTLKQAPTSFRNRTIE